MIINFDNWIKDPPASEYTETFLLDLAVTYLKQSMYHYKRYKTLTGPDSGVKKLELQYYYKYRNWAHEVTKLLIQFE
jgi:hypothetical protein